MILVLINAHPKAQAALLDPGRRIAAVSLDQASNIADAPAFGNHPRLSENPGGQLRNCKPRLGKSPIYPTNIIACARITQSSDDLSLCGKQYMKFEREESSSQRRVGGITKVRQSH
jgi:hypothetical protein